MNRHELDHGREMIEALACGLAADAAARWNVSISASPHIAYDVGGYFFSLRFQKNEGRRRGRTVAIPIPLQHIEDYPSDDGIRDAVYQLLSTRLDEAAKAESQR